MSCQSAAQPGRRHRIPVRGSQAALRALIAHLQCTHEAERGEIIRVLHDELLSRLARINFDLGELRRWRRGRAAEFARRWSAAAQSLAEAMHIVGRARTALRPALLEHCGLQAALQQRVAEWAKRERSHCEFIGAKFSRPVAPPVALQLFRLFEEVLRGLTRTCRPGDLIVRLTRVKTILTLHCCTRAVATNGFRSLAAAPEILAVRESVRRLRGKLIMAQPAAPNVCVTIRVPLRSRGRSAGSGAASRFASGRAKRDVSAAKGAVGQKATGA